MKQLVVAAAVIRRGARVLIARRRAGTHMGLHWEFPGGRVEPGEHPEATIVREIQEELGCQVRVQRFYDMEPHVYPDRQVFLLFYLCELAGDQEPQPLEHQEIRWASPADLGGIAFAPADRRVALRLMAEAAPG